MLTIYDIKVDELNEEQKNILRYLEYLPGKLQERNYAVNPKDVLLMTVLYPKTYNRSELFSKIGFMGSGARSVLHCGAAHRLLDEAFSHMSGIEQEGGMGSEYVQSRVNEAEDAIEEIVRDLARFLTGKEIKFKNGSKKKNND